MSSYVANYDFQMVTQPPVPLHPLLSVTRSGASYVFNYRATPTMVFAVNAVLRNKNLYIKIDPNSITSLEFPRNAFVAILEYGEDQLGCEHILLHFAQDCSDRAMVIRTFVFFGFSVLSPMDTLGLHLHDGQIYLFYKCDPE